MKLSPLPLILVFVLGLHALADDPMGNDAPHSSDARLIVERFAVAPDIVHPVSIACDARGRLLVIESHTHFRPPNYKGPVHDRIRLLEDTDGDGKADRFTTFFEGTKATMDIAVHPDGSVYLATRNEVLRLRDTKGDGNADRKERIVFLDTRGNYPHNGLSGLAFDSRGDLYFGMGENSGEDYKLVGSDGSTITGGGEGGNIFWCTADGKKLRRLATGFWNPFGVCLDIFGRIFAVDNDPDAMPPCRMLHVVEGGDYGYQYRYGRSGRHPFQCWNGQLPGTLPMAAGTGEAPCEIVSYESDGLPSDYLGSLLVASWADHRIERYVVKERGASVVAERQPFVQGGQDFRPVGIAIAPDGSLYVSDWVLSDYNLHNRGAIWHIRARQGGRRERPSDAAAALLSRHRPLREQAAAELARDEAGRGVLRGKLQHPLRIRAAALTALLNVADPNIDLDRLAQHEPLPPLRAMAVRSLVARQADVSRFLAQNQPPAVRMEAIAGLRDKDRLLELTRDADPFLRHAAVRQLARSPELLAAINVKTLDDSRLRTGLLLAQREGGRSEATRLLPQFLNDPDPEIRFLAAKWIADRKVSAVRSLLVENLNDPSLSTRLYFAHATALARIDNRDVNEGTMADHFLGRARDRAASADARVTALRLVPSNQPKLTVDILAGLTAEKDAALQLEAVRALNEHPNAARSAILLKIATNSANDNTVRAEALVGLDPQAGNAVPALLKLASGMNKDLREEALRALTGSKLTAVQQSVVEDAGRRPGAGDLAARVLGKPFVKGRPQASDIPAWLKRLDGPASAVAGRRVFFHPRLAGCYRCHRVDGRGQDVGPDLSAVGRTERSHILESILQPNNLVPPHYQVWSIVTHSGKVYTGLLIRTYLDEYTYVDAAGARFKINTRDIAESRAAPGSIMPAGLADLLTDQEVRNLLAYLCSRR
jgi:putative membrane-bound dehydrogenase-like protein